MSRSERNFVKALFFVGVLVGVGIAIVFAALSFFVEPVWPVESCVGCFGTGLVLLTGIVGVARSTDEKSLSRKMALVLKYEALPLGICAVAGVLWAI